MRQTGTAGGLAQGLRGLCPEKSPRYSPRREGSQAGAPTRAGRIGGYCILAVGAGGRGRGFAGFFAAGSSITTTGLGANTGEGPVKKVPSGMVE
jgi:hypothetical protein